MNNGEKFKTIEEREVAFNSYCGKMYCGDCPLFEAKADCEFGWLALEADEGEATPETINDIIYELNSNAKTKALAKRIELARINDEQRWRKDIADTQTATAERMMENIECTEKTRCANCITKSNLITTRSNLITIRDLCQKISMKYDPSQKKYHTPEIQTINTCFLLACEALRKE